MKQETSRAILGSPRCIACNQRREDVTTHKLHGELKGLWACSVEFDCRIVFGFQTSEGEEDAIVLVDIGSHDEVY
jgi:mRNA-degrading endonuclease YafQ of YafQ-DinJ toxin-antitoxin module